MCQALLPNINPSTAADPRRKGPRRLKAHGVWVRPAAEAHADMASLLRAVAGSRPGFVDGGALGTMAPMAQVIMSDGEGSLFVLDTSGPAPALRPWSEPVPGGPPGGASGGGDGGPPSVGSPDEASDEAPGDVARGGPVGGPDKPSFAEQALRAAGEKLAEDFLVSLFSGRPIGTTLSELMNRGTIISGLGGAALQNLGNMLMGSLMGALFGGVTDESSLGSQLAAKFGPQLMGMAQEHMGKVLDMAKHGGFSPEVMDQIEAYLFGEVSTANIPLGKALDAGGAGYVLVEGGPHALKVGDVALHDNCSKPPGTYVDGHPTILINGAAIGLDTRRSVAAERRDAGGSRRDGPHGRASIAARTSPPPPPPRTMRASRSVTHARRGQDGGKCPGRERRG